jgi:CRP-like cAMP-binding protein
MSGCFAEQYCSVQTGTSEGFARLRRRSRLVFSQGDVADTVFYIQKGRIKVLVVSEQDNEAVVGILEPGQFFGEGCLNGHPMRISTTMAMEECLITSITKDAMLTTLKSEPRFSEPFMAYLLSRNSRIEEDLIDQLFNSSEKRLARLLLLLAKFREGRHTAADCGACQPGDPGGSDRHHTLPSQLFHEQVSQARLHYLYR